MNTVDDVGEKLVAAMNVLVGIESTELAAWAEECDLDPSEVRDALWSMTNICMCELRRQLDKREACRAIDRVKDAAAGAAPPEARD